MDIQLPDIDGVDALARLRADERSAAIPVVALTAQAMSGDRERFLAAGFDGYISKPVNIAELRRHRRRALQRTLDEQLNGAARILVVDDVPENVRLLEAVLAPRGYDVVVAQRRPRGTRARRVGEARPRPARRRDAGAGRLRRLPAAAASARRRPCCP